MPRLNESKDTPFKKVSHRPWDDLNKIVSTPNISSSKKTSPVESGYSNSKDSIEAENDKIFEIDPNLIDRWRYKDRQPNELGDITSLAKEMKELGQQFPCVIRQKEDRYEIIAGERRWQAALHAGIKLKVNLRNFKSDEEALICQFIENEKNPISDYSRGMHFAQAIKDGIITQYLLTDKLNISKQEVSRLLSFKDIPPQLKESIGDFSKVSARTAAEIRILCNKDPNNIQALIALSDKISSGIGAVTLLKEVAKFFSPDKASVSTEKILSNSGRHLFTWRKDGNGNISISFPKDIRGKIKIKRLENDFKELILEQLREMDT